MDDSTPRDDETDPFELAAQKRWLDLARLGKEKWNTWADAELQKGEEERAYVDLSGQTIDVSDFVGFIFPASASFRHATFSADAYFVDATFSTFANFSKATFSAEAYFRWATFSDFADFRWATFSDFADFREATFSADADFSGATFSDFAGFNSVTMKSVWQMGRARVSGSLEAQNADIQGHAHFTGIRFQVPPDLISTAFKQPPSFLGSTFRYPCDNRFWGKCSVNDAEARYRRLKQLATDTHDHELELRLFALETKAKRFHTLTTANPLHWPGLVLNFGYGWVSDFGQSVLRPLGWLLLTVGLAFATFWSTAPATTSFWVSAVAAGVNVFPFAGQAVLGREIMTKGLCPMPETDVGHLDCLTTLYTISAVEGVLGLVFLFLIVLGLRNRFRIR